MHSLNVCVPLGVHSALHGWSVGQALSPGAGAGGGRWCGHRGGQDGLPVLVQMQRPDLNTNDKRCSAPGEKLGAQRGSRDPWGKVREGLWEEAACERCFRHAERGWQSGGWSVVSRREARACAEYGKGGRQGWEGGLQPVSEEQAGEVGLSLKSQRSSKHTRTAAPSAPWELVRSANSPAPPRPAEWNLQGGAQWPGFHKSSR